MSLRAGTRHDLGGGVSIVTPPQPAALRIRVVQVPTTSELLDEHYRIYGYPSRPDDRDPARARSLARGPSRGPKLHRDR